jgi:hypothetical protein
MKKRINQILDVKRVVIVHPYSNDDIFNPDFGGARLILEQLNFFRNRGYDTQLISLQNIPSLFSLFYRIRGILQGGRHKTIYASEERRWLLNLIYVLLVELISRIDVFFYIKIKKLLKTNREPTQLLIYNYPYGIGNLPSILKPSSMEVAIYEHNVEWKFFKEKIRNNIFSRFLLFFAKKIELSNLKKVNYVFCANENDKKLLIKEGLKSKNIIVWIPLTIEKHVREINPPVRIRNRLKNKFIVGFLGSDFEPNIIAVENIIKIAKKVPKDVVFLVIGSVYESFRKRDYIPSNVIFTGYVNNPYSYLSICDSFINPKTTSNTGIETKMLDYLKFKKPIITTKTGALGFESFSNVIISDIENFPSVIKSLAYK